MATANATHAQGELQLKLYDLRREPRLRQAREWYFKNYFADTLDEALALAPMGSEGGTSFMMVVTYWDQACAYLDHGLLHEDLFFETSPEFFTVWERVKPSVKEGRERFSNPLFLAHLERAATRFEAWIEKRAPGYVSTTREFMKQMREQPAKAA